MPRLRARIAHPRQVLIDLGLILAAVMILAFGYSWLLEATTAYQGKSLHEWKTLASDLDPGVRASAAQALGAIIQSSGNSSALSKLAAMIREDASQGVRLAAVKAVPPSGPGLGSETRCELLVEALESCRDDSVCEAIANQIGPQGGSTPSKGDRRAFDTLRASLLQGHGEKKARVGALLRFVNRHAELAPAGSEAIAKLIEQSPTLDGFIWSLSETARPSPESSDDVFIENMTVASPKRDAPVGTGHLDMDRVSEAVLAHAERHAGERAGYASREQGLRWIAQQGNPAKVAPGLVRAHLRGGDQEIPAAMALTLLPTDVAVPALISILRREGASPVGAIWALRDIGPAARAAVPDLGRLVLHPEYGRDAAVALSRMGDAVRMVIPGLVKALQSGSPAAVKASATALGALGPIAADALPALEECFAAGEEQLSPLRKRDIDRYVAESQRTGLFEIQSAIHAITGRWPDPRGNP